MVKLALIKQTFDPGMECGKQKIGVNVPFIKTLH